MRVLICDDNKYLLDSLNQIVSEFSIKHNIPVDIVALTECTDIDSNNAFFDFAFLDVEMPNANGLEMVNYLRQFNEHILVFIVTAYQTYLDKAMDLQVFRYLPKPPDKIRIFDGLASAMQKYTEKTAIVNVDTTGAQKVYIDDILYIKIEKRKTLLVTKKGEFLSNNSLAQWKGILNYDFFVQPHNSYIVNLKNVVRLEGHTLYVENSNGEYIPIKIAQRKYTEFKNKFFDYIAQS